MSPFLFLSLSVRHAKGNSRCPPPHRGQGGGGGQARTHCPEPDDRSPTVGCKDAMYFSSSAQESGCLHRPLLQITASVSTKLSFNRAGEGGISLLQAEARRAASFPLDARLVC